MSVSLERGQVFLNQAEATLEHAGHRLVPGDVVRLWMDRPGSASRKRSAAARDLDVVFEDESLLVINKPAGLLSVPLERRGDAESVLDLIKDYYRAQRHRGRPLVVHRIDRDTSGLVVFARSAQVQQHLKDQFRRHAAGRLYQAVVYGAPDPPRGTWRDRLVWDTGALIQKQTHPSDPAGADAVSHYETIERFAGTTLIHVRLETGKRNQIRLQARLRGHTLVGEKRYVFYPPPPRPIAFPRQALHAWRLSIAHPVDGRPLEFEAPLPADFAELLTRLRRA